MKAVAKERINANKAQAFKRVGGKNQANLAGLAKLDVRPAPPPANPCMCCRVRALR